MKRKILWLASIGIVMLFVSVLASRDANASGAEQDIADINGAWVELYESKGFKGRRLIVAYPNAISDFDTVKTDDGKKGFNDKASSGRWQIPQGWQAVLFEKKNFKGNRFPLIGTGKGVENHDLGPFGGKTSSLRWERMP